MFNRRLAIGVMTAALLVMGVSACTVQPLYSNDEQLNGRNTVSVGLANSRVAQQVRNRLLFLLNGSGAQPDNPLYKAKLSVVAQSQGILSVATSDESDISARRVRLDGTLKIDDVATGETLKTYTRVKYASFDTSSQAFANSRALTDAQNRAAAEMAEEFRNLIVAFTKRQ